MLPALGDLSVRDHQNGVGLGDRCQPVSYDDDGSAVGKLGERLVYIALRSRIGLRRRFVEDQYRCILDGGSGNR